MKEKLKFRQISKHIEAEEDKESVSKSIQKEEEKKEEKELSSAKLQIYDILLEKVSLSNKLKSLNTEVKEIPAKKTVEIPLFDLFLTKETIKPIQIPSTDLAYVPVSKETVIELFDIKLTSAKVKKLPLFNTDIKASQISQTEQTRTEIPLFDLKLEPKPILKHSIKLNTEISILKIENVIEMLASSGGKEQMPVFEEFINCNKRLPRSFGECFNSPFVILIGEEKYEWHLPIIYGLKELFCEISDKHPKVTFREPELYEEGVEEIVDSLDPHSLAQFSFESKIEFLDARKMSIAVSEFAKAVKGRLESGFLQQFGILAIAVKPEDLDKTKEALKFEGLNVYTCKPDDEKYQSFCSKIFGISSLDNFFNNLKKYESCLNSTLRTFSTFVKRGADASDRFQYPLKVAVFVYLLNDLKNRKKRVIENFEELCRFLREILEGEIKVEAQIETGIIPDLIYLQEGKEIYLEIETLIGTFEPLKKIDETVEKYKDVSGKIWIILKPVSAMIHYEEIKERKKAYRILYDDKEIDFKVLTLLTSKDRFKWDLVSIDEFIRE